MNSKDTEFKKNLITKLTEKSLSPNSVNLYVRNLELLNDDLPLKNFNFLSKTDEILKKIHSYKDNTARGYLISIVTILKMFKDDNKKLNKMYQFYNEKMNEIAKKIKDNTNVGELTQVQKENWIELDSVKKQLDDLKNMVEKFKNNKVLNNNQYNTLLSYLILSLYTLEEPRRNKDYQDCNIVGNYTDNLPNDKNYISPNKLIFNVYKTSKKYGKQIFDIKPELKEVIDIYVKHHPLLKGKLTKKDNVPFLVYYDGSPLDSVNSITRILNKIFGKKIGSSQLRKIYVSDKFGKNSELQKLQNEQKEVAEKMGHTVATQNYYYIKDEPKKN